MRPVLLCPPLYQHRVHPPHPARPRVTVRGVVARSRRRRSSRAHIASRASSRAHRARTSGRCVRILIVED